LPKKKPGGVSKYMPDEQDMIWLKGLQFNLNACKYKLQDTMYILKILQQELKKTKQYINSECRQSEFEYSTEIIECINWNPDSENSQELIIKLKNET